MSSRYRIGIDIGGTFTDGVRIDRASGTMLIEKSSTTPSDPSIGFMEVLNRLVAESGAAPGEIEFVVHATTTATNAVLQRAGARAGLIVTKGFGDVLEIARQVRHELYNLQTDKPVPLIAREDCMEVSERLDYRGNVVVALDETAVSEAAAILRERHVNSIAVCFLHSYRNPIHELQAQRAIRRVHPAADISLSSAIAPEIREYWRASTTAINAYVAPVVSTYLDSVERKLVGAKISAGLHLMQSNGGIMTSEVAKRQPVFLLESGPAAGVAAAAFFCELSGISNAVSFDMGGTTAKMGLILDGEPRVISEFEVGGASGSGTGLAKGGGYPVLGSVLDLVEVGAGGGSIAWIDSGGVLRVGPRSAGALPGPACYPDGGSEPTITDASLVLGRINPSFFLGGAISLRSDAARSAIQRRCADPLGMSPVETAMGVVEIANETMAQAMRLVSVARGYDPREFALVAFGGAGPLHANALAAELGIPRVIVPPSPGVASALGMLASDIRHDFRITQIQLLSRLDLAATNQLIDGFARAARDLLTSEAIEYRNTELSAYLDMRYVGQSWKIRIPTDTMQIASGDLVRLKVAFDEQHELTYGYSVESEPVEVVNIGLAAIGRISKPSLRSVPRGTPNPIAAVKGEREVYFREFGAYVTASVLDRYRLEVRNRVVGPAVVEERDSTLIVHPGFEAEVGEFGVISIRPAD